MVRKSRSFDIVHRNSTEQESEEVKFRKLGQRTNTTAWKSLVVFLSETINSRITNSFVYCFSCFSCYYMNLLVNTD